MEDTRPFYPLYGPSAGTGAGSLLPSVTITASASAASAALPGNIAAPNGFQQIQIANKTTAWAHINFGETVATVTAATVAAGYPVAPGGVVVVTVNALVCAASVILDAAPGTETAVVFTRGTGT